MARVWLLLCLGSSVVAHAESRTVELRGRVVDCVVSDVGKTQRAERYAYLTLALDSDGAPPAWRGRLPVELRFVGPEDRVARVGSKVVITTDLDERRPPTPATTLPLVAIRPL